MSLPKYINNYPAFKETDWSDKLQGVTHSDKHWFFTQLNKLHRFPVASDLNDEKYPSNAAHQEMPFPLKSDGYNHFGDPDYIKYKDQGYIFIPVEGDDGSDPVLAVFKDDAKMSYIGCSNLPKQTHRLGTNRAGWVAIDPRHKILHSSHNQISEKYPIYRYKVDFDQLSQKKVLLKPVEDLLLKDKDGSAFSIDKYIQGGCFSPDGKLYICSGKHRDDYKGGIRVFSPAGEYLHQSVIHKTDTNDFQYEYKSSFDHYEEPEGITFWDVSDLNAPNIDGQLHAIILVNQPGKDNIYFKHYQV